PISVVARQNHRLADVEVEQQVGALVGRHVELADQLDAALYRAWRVQWNFDAGIRNEDDRVGSALAGEHEAQLRVVAGLQGRLAELSERAVGQVEKVDLARRIQRDVGPAAVARTRARALVDAHLADGHVHRGESARWRIGQRHRQGSHANGARAPTAASAARGDGNYSQDGKQSGEAN